MTANTPLNRPGFDIADIPVLPTGPTPEEERPENGKRQKTKAENLFDKAVYGGISYFAQAATGVVLTDWLTNKGGRRYFNRIAEWMGPSFLSKITTKRGPAAIEEATSWIIISTMIMVGNAFLIPVKMLENNKPQIVRRINERMNRKREARGETIPEEELAEQEKLLSQLDKEPKQSWWSLLGGRGFGLGCVYAVNWLIGNRNNEMMAETTAETVKASLDTAGLPAAARSKTVHNYAHIAFYDMFYSIVSAGGLYMYSHLINPPKKKKREGEPEEAPAAATETLASEAPANGESVPVRERKKLAEKVEKRKAPVAAASHRNSVTRDNNNSVSEISV